MDTFIKMKPDLFFQKTLYSIMSFIKKTLTCFVIILKILLLYSAVLTWSGFSTGILLALKKE